MLGFTTHNYFGFTRKEFWFYNGEPVKEATYNVYTASKKAPNINGPFQEKYKTPIIYLEKPEDNLFKAIHSTYRYDIRAAEKKKLTYKTILAPQKTDCITLFKAYNNFAKTKDIEQMNLRRIIALQKAGSLYITKILLNDIEISTHVYVFDKKTASLTHSFHNVDFLDGKIRSEANKYLHWKDILLFKSMGLKEYDFGGLNEKKHPGIGKFKLNFGGEVVENYRFIKTSFFIFALISLYKKIQKNG